ncbi:MAG: hypothetical protein K2H64_06245 [Desulfovibrio sp.]|nr:hypothetical protein [Desulfovibrio sp.]
MKNSLFLPLILCVAILAEGCSGAPVEEPETEHSLFARLWNSRAEKIRGGENYFLPADGTGATRALEQMTNAFATPLYPEQERELEALREEAVTAFHIYAEYKKNNLKSGALRLNKNMTDQELALALNKWLGIKSGKRIPDYPTAETVKTMIFMNDFCAFFMNNRKEIHAKGADTAIMTCEELAAEGYPWLNSLIRGEKAEKGSGFFK